MNAVEPILFPLDGTPPAASLVYRPWGTRTIKMKVTADQPIPTLRLRPRNVNAAEANQGVFQGYADDSDAFVIGWGGGHEPGPCLKAEDYLLALERCAPFEAGDTSTIFFNLTHVGPDVPDEATVTIEAYDEKSGEVTTAVTITLTKPTDYSDKAVQFKTAVANIWQPQGSQVATYDPRWWPRPFHYIDLPSVPLQIMVNGKKLLVQWNGRDVATITDNSNPPIVGTPANSYELFAFDEWNWVLRIWFFWHDTRIGKSHEVPDAERFDLIIRKHDGRVTLACTDLHWREVWGEVKEGEALRASIGLSNSAKLKLIKEGVSKLKGMILREKGHDYDKPYNPIDRSVARRAETLGKDIRGTERGKGVEAHVPCLENVLAAERIPSNLTSSDVRLG